MSANRYNLDQIAKGNLTGDDLTKLVTEFQKAHLLNPDGYCGPVTLEALRPQPAPVDELAIVRGTLFGAGIRQFPSHPSWYGGPLKTPNGDPLAVVVHTSATGPGTAITMAKNRSGAHKPGERMASWHLTIDTDGSIVQQVPLTSCAWHAGSTSAKNIPGVGWANYTTVGIEIVSLDDKNFPQEQIDAYARVLRAIVRAYRIPREHAMISHASIDPARRVDPGTEWMTVHAPKVLDYAYA